MPKGLFISFESIDGVGQTTPVDLLSEHLKKVVSVNNLGNNVIVTKEPGDSFRGSLVGEGIRNLLFRSPTTNAMHPGVSDLLFLADHVQNAEDIRQSVVRGDIVLSDRYADSQFAYAPHRPEECNEAIFDVYRKMYGIVPDLTILLLATGYDSSENAIEWAFKRANSRKGLEEGKQDGKSWNSVLLQSKIQRQYISNIGGQARTEMITVDETDSVKYVHYQIVKAVERRFPELCLKQ